jgi:hypothetical protein
VAQPYDPRTRASSHAPPQRAPFAAGEGKEEASPGVSLLIQPTRWTSCHPAPPGPPPAHHSPPPWTSPGWAYGLLLGGAGVPLLASLLTPNRVAAQNKSPCVLGARGARGAPCLPFGGKPDWRPKFWSVFPQISPEGIARASSPHPAGTSPGRRAPPGEAKKNYSTKTKSQEIRGAHKSRGWGEQHFRSQQQILCEQHYVPCAG